MNDKAKVYSKRPGLDIKFPPNETQSILFSKPGAGYDGNPSVDSWAEAPKGSGTFILASVNGSIQWIGTLNCDD